MKLIMVYDPRTGVTTYADPSALDASAPPVPSTATSFAPAKSDYALAHFDPGQLPSGFWLTEQPGGFGSTVAEAPVDLGNPFRLLGGERLGANQYSLDDTLARAQGGGMFDRVLGTPDQIRASYRPSPFDNNYQYAVGRNGTIERAYGTGDQANGYKTESELRTLGLLPTGYDAHGMPIYGDYSAVANPKPTTADWESSFELPWQMLVSMLIGAGAGGAFAGGSAAGEGGAAASTAAASEGSTTSGLLPALERGAAQGAISGSIGASERGNSPIGGAVRGGLTGAATAGTNYGGQNIAQALDFLPGDTSVADAFATDPTLADETRRRLAGGMLPEGGLLLNPNDPAAMEQMFGTAQIEQQQMPQLMRAASVFRPAAGMLPDGTMLVDANNPTAMTSLLGEPQPLAFSAPPLSGFNVTGQQTPAPQDSTKQALSVAEKVAKIGSALAQLHEGNGIPENAPQRAAGQSDADYGQQLVQYANLDPQALADQGLTPGTAPYYQYIMDQMDSVINQVTDGLDPTDANLSDRLRQKTREELDQLQRALFVRGQIGQLMGSGQYTDPFTGNPENVIAPSGQLVQPSIGAYHRGLARSVDEMARMSPGEARRYAGGMLGRSADLFGMQQSADERRMEEMLSQQSEDEDLKRRRMFALFGQ